MDPLRPGRRLPDLRQAIAEYVSRTRTSGWRARKWLWCRAVSQLFSSPILALVDEGDEVIYPNPGFPIYESMINYVGGRAIPIPLREERDFSVDVKELASLITNRTS